jgi:hypothetical protein
MKGRNSATLRQEREPSPVWRQGLQKAAGRKESEKGMGGWGCDTEKETRGYDGRERIRKDGVD